MAAWETDFRKQTQKKNKQFYIHGGKNNTKYATSDQL